MIIVLAILLAAATLIALAYPIWRTAAGRSAATPASAAEGLDELLAQREAAFQAIRDLQFDHEVGKITDEDLMIFEASLKQHAAETLRRLDNWESDLDRSLGAQLEKRVAARRGALSRGSRPCPACGNTIAAGDQFCTACGAMLEPAQFAAVAVAGPKCPKCGRAVGPDDRFCPRCGQTLAQPVAG